MNQRTLFFVLLFVSLTMCAFCQQGVRLLYTDPTTGYTKEVSDSNPLPTSALVTVGSVTVDPAAPVSENSLTVLSATVSAQDVTSLANRKSINFFNHSSSVTCWISLDSATASAAADIGIPLFPYGFAGFELDSSKVASVYAAGVASVTVYQDGY